MPRQPNPHSSALDALRRHKGLRQTSALFVKNALVAWRNRWSTSLRLLAPLVFLALALLVQEGLKANTRRTGRIRASPLSEAAEVGAIPGCSSDLFIYDRPCLNFVYTPDGDERVAAIVASVMQHNEPPIPPERVRAFSSRMAADEFIQRRQHYVLGAVHFSTSGTGQLQFIVQSNTSVPAFKGYVQSPNAFFQLPFMSAIARETARHALAAAGRADEAAALQWRPRMAAFPHPQLSPGASSYILPPFIFVACMFATISLLSSLVHEKESGLRQALTTMGLQQLAYWASWWLFEAVMWAVMAWCITGFGVALGLPLFQANDPWLLFLLFWLFGMAMTSFACCLSVFMSTTQSAYNGALALIVVGWVCQALAALGLPYAPNLLYARGGIGRAFFWVFALLPWNPLTKGILDLAAAAAHTDNPGLRFADRSRYCTYTPDPSKASLSTNMAWLYMDDNCVFSLEQVLLTLLVQAAGWLLAALYLDNVRPDVHGVKLPLWYPLSPSYWANMFRAGGASTSGVSVSSCAVGALPAQLFGAKGAPASKAGGGGGGTPVHAKGRRTPFAGVDANRKAAKSIADARDDRALVIRCSSAGGGSGGAGQLERSGGGDGAVATQSSQRHSVSSGFLRRRDIRRTNSSDEHAVGAALADAAAGRHVPPALRLGGQPSQQLQQPLGGQPSVSMMMQLSGSSSDGPGGMLHQLDGVAAGSTISLAQYQQLQLQQQVRQGPLRQQLLWGLLRWPRASRGGGAHQQPDKLLPPAAVAVGVSGCAPGCLGSLSHAGKDAAAAAPLTGTYGMVPVVLDSGVLQEEQRMKEAWFVEPGGGAWTPKQDLLQVFGLRKVYRMPAARGGWRRWWPAWWPLGQCGSRHQLAQRRRQQQQQQAAPQQFVAVADSWFGVPKGQLLCLLGPNGAGKTTTLSCLIGALPPSGGDIRVMGHSLLAPGGLEHAQGVMGVCPQFDVLWDELTGREHMHIYGCIKGLPAREVTQQGAALLEQVQLTPAAAKRSASYSGGMKRRLSVALALLGGPQLVFLDEPTTGMDPISRRAVWDAIDAAKQGSAVVLTTHSMEEADALGDRIGIMVRGRLRVLGGSLALKQKYGNGYQLRLRLKDSHPMGQLAQMLSMQAAAGAAAGLEDSVEAAAGHHPRPCSQGGMRPPAAAALQQRCSGDGASSSTGLQELVSQLLGLAPSEEGRQMLHYAVPTALSSQLQQLLELLDQPEQQRRLGLAELHVSLATLEEVFLSVVKQAEQDYAALHGHSVVVELPESGQQLEVPVGQEAAVDPSSGDVYAVEWVQDEWGKLAVLGVRLMGPTEQQHYWQHRHALS